MTTTTPIRWWTPATVVVATAVTVMALIGLGAGGSDSALAWVSALGALVSGALILAGLAVRRRRAVAGSWMVIVGSALMAPGLIGLPLAAFVIIGGLWTGNLVTSSRRATEIDLGPRQTSMTRHWYWWLVAAVGLGAVGFLVLVIWPVVTPDDCTETNPCWQDTAAWATWILSWMTAFVTGGIGLLLGALELINRHRTRLA